MGPTDDGSRDSWDRARLAAGWQRTLVRLILIELANQRAARARAAPAPAAATCGAAVVTAPCRPRSDR